VAPPETYTVHLLEIKQAREGWTQP
jgi:hypothetical protein